MKLIASLVTFNMIAVALVGCSKDVTESNKPTSKSIYPAVWFAAINDPNKPDWEILPQEAKAGEVILSKRNELGIVSNFAGNLTNRRRRGRDLLAHNRRPRAAAKHSRDRDDNNLTLATRVLANII